MQIYKYSVRYFYPLAYWLSAGIGIKDQSSPQELFQKSKLSSSKENVQFQITLRWFCLLLPSPHIHCSSENKIKQITKMMHISIKDRMTYIWNEIQNIYMWGNMFVFYVIVTSVVLSSLLSVYSSMICPFLLVCLLWLFRKLFFFSNDQTKRIKWIKIYNAIWTYIWNSRVRSIDYLQRILMSDYRAYLVYWTSFQGCLLWILGIWWTTPRLVRALEFLAGQIVWAVQG